MRRLACGILLFLLSLANAFGEDAIGGRGSSDTADRTRLARSLYRHTFENIRDPDTGLLLPESASLGSEQWPDFWEPIRAVGFPEYLIPSVRIVEDDSDFVPGAYRDVPNHALKMDFDGTRVGVRTRSPVPINPRLAYEFSVMTRDTGIKGARIRIGVDWMRIDPATVEVLRSDEIPNLPTGQMDWSVAPRRLLVNEPPETANAARFFVIVDRLPGSVGGEYHGAVWVDDISLRPLPKVIVGAPRAPSGGGDGRVIPVLYSGLYDNVPDPGNPGYFKGKRYVRQVEISDVYGVPLNLEPEKRVDVSADETGAAVEEIFFPRDRYGVYYFNIRLYDADNRLATDVMRAVAVMRPERHRDALALRSHKPVFGVRSGIVPDEILNSEGLLRRILERSGSRMTKITPWRDAYSGGAENNAYYTALAAEMRTLRAAGIAVTGVIRPPAAMFGDDDIFQAVTGNVEKLNRILAEAGRRLGLFVDSWQWGDDFDGGMRNVPPGKNVNMLLATLRDFAGGLPLIGTVRLDDAERPTFPVRPDVTQGYLSENGAAAGLWPLAAPVFPWLYEPYFLERGVIYPPRRLSVLAPPPPVDMLEEQTRLQARTSSWISIEAAKAHPYEPNAAAERVQLQEMMVRAVYAAALSPEAVFLGELFNPVNGLLRNDSTGANTLETMARPTYIAASTITELLEGAQYLGEMWLLPPYEAHVFRRAGGNDSVIALWHNGQTDERILPRREIANGPPLRLVDWAGNETPLPAGIPVRRTPVFITGLPSELALTRMSIRINPEQEMRSTNRRQNQTIEMVNHFARQTPVQLRLKYAAKLPGLSMENNWMIKPEEMRLNLMPFSPALLPGRMRYSVAPDPTSQVQHASPGVADKSGSKIAQADVSVNTSPPADMTIYLPFRLHSDLDVDIEQLKRTDDPNFVTLQLKLRWFPPESERRRLEIKLTPYYMKRGQMKETAAFPISVKAHPPEMRGDPTAPFESVELRIPRSPQTQTWVGVDEVGGSNFYIADVTDFLMAD